MTTYDVIVLGEPLIEFSSTDPISAGAMCRLDVSGDVVNAAAAAAAAGARTAVIARVSDDELGDAVAARFVELGVDIRFLLRGGGSQGVYVQHADPSGERQFLYARSCSAGSTLSPDDLPADVLESAGAVVASGITGALSASCRDTLVEAARRATRFVYDPNYRPRLTGVDDARALLHEIARHAALITPSFPTETRTLLDSEDAASAATTLHELGVPTVAVTCGASGVHISGDGVPDVPLWQPSVPAPTVVDQTGAGDVFVATVAARLALGDDLPAAIRLGAAASSLAVGGAGGCGGIQDFDAVAAHARTAPVAVAATGALR